MGIEDEYRKVVEQVKFDKLEAERKDEQARALVMQRVQRILDELSSSKKFYDAKGFSWKQNGSTIVLSSEKIDISILCEGDKIIHLSVQPKNGQHKVGYSRSEQVNSIPQMLPFIAKWIQGYE